MMEQGEQQYLTFGASRRQVAVGKIAYVAGSDPIRLSCGKELTGIPVAYQTYGTLNAEKSNAILICHALTGDQYVASGNPVTGKAGWWHFMIGRGKPIDTDRFFVICSNVLGGCLGTYGPKHTDMHGAVLGLNFPVVTIRDMVEVQKRLVESFGIEKLFAVIGGSMGGMQVLEWAASYPDRVCCAMPLATASRHNAQNIAYHEIGRQAIMADPEWRRGHYHDEGTFPEKGLSVARMTAHVTYLSENALQHKFGRMLQDGSEPTYSFEANFQVESYLRHQGVSFVERFDPNSYIYITKAADYFDIAEKAEGRLASVFAGSPVSFCLLSFSSDWLYPTVESQRLVRAINASGADVSFTEIDSPHGHDAFLLQHDGYMRVVAGFLDGKAKLIGV
jgi:homoserine O-acetyltransferase/O-succinyltransferase